MENINYEICSYDDIKEELPLYWNFASAVQATKLICVCAKLTTNLLGVLIAESSSNEQFIILRFIYVIPEYRREKIGTKMWETILFKYRLNYQKYSVSFIESKKDLGLSNFLMSLGFTYARIDCSGIIVNRNNWVSTVLPKIQAISDSVSCNYKLRSELNLEEEKLFSNTIEKENIPDYLNPLSFFEEKEEQIFFLSSKGDLIGWCVFSKINTKTIDLRCTYVVERYRNNKYVFAFWKIMTWYIVHKIPTVNRLVFYYDNANKSLDLFYKRILGDCEFKYFNRITYEYEIPIV